MNIGRIIAALALALFASQAVAQNWVTVTSANADGYPYEVDKNSIRRGNDGLVYFSDRLHGLVSGDAVDCSNKLSYVLNEDLANGEHRDHADWRDVGEDLGPVEPNSFGEAELQFVCANVR
jgi:hypothetical protein